MSLRRSGSITRLSESRIVAERQSWSELKLSAYRLYQGVTRPRHLPCRLRRASAGPPKQGEPRWPTRRPGAAAPSSNRNVMILLSYLWLLALIPLVVEKEDREVQWHAKHGLVLTVAELIFWVAFQVLTFVLGSFLGCLVAIFAPLVGLGIPGAPHLRDHQGHQRPAADRSGDQPVRGQVLDDARRRRESSCAVDPVSRWRSSSICGERRRSNSPHAPPSAPFTCIKPRCRRCTHAWACSAGSRRRAATTAKRASASLGRSRADGWR